VEHSGGDSRGGKLENIYLGASEHCPIWGQGSVNQKKKKKKGGDQSIPAKNRVRFIKGWRVQTRRKKKAAERWLSAAAAIWQNYLEFKKKRRRAIRGGRSLSTAG